MWERLSCPGMFCWRQDLDRRLLPLDYERVPEAQMKMKMKMKMDK